MSTKSASTVRRGKIQEQDGMLDGVIFLKGRGRCCEGVRWRHWLWHRERLTIPQSGGRGPGCKRKCVRLMGTKVGGCEMDRGHT